MNRKLRFTLSEESNPLRTRTIMDLCDYLTDKMLVPRFAESGANWGRASMAFFTFDNTCDPLEPTGTIYFQVPPLLAGCAESLEKAIAVELSRLGIKVGRIAHEPAAKDRSSPVMRIHITENPTASLQPPEVNISRARGAVVLRDLLGYAQVEGHYRFEAGDLLRRVQSVTDEQVAAATASPVRDRAARAGVSRLPSPVGTRAVRRCLDELRAFAVWARDHGYHQLEAA